MRLFIGIGNALILYAILAVLLVVLFAVKVFSAPFLVCDPNLNTDYYEVENLAYTSGQSIPAEADGSIRLDLAPLATDGSHDILVRACNAWGCSSDSPFTFTKSPSPLAPANLRLEP